MYQYIVLCAVVCTSLFTGSFKINFVLFQFVPLVVEACIQIVEEKGLDNQGIYRVPGNSGAVNQLQEELNKVCEHREDEYDDGFDVQMLAFSQLHTHTNTHNRFMAFLDLVWDYAGEPAPER